MKLSLINPKRCIAFIFLLFFVNKIVAQATVIHSFSPSFGPIGSLVKMQGESLQHTTAVYIGTTQAIIVAKSDKQLVLMLMPGSVNGQLKIKTSHTIISSVGTFTVVPSGSLFDVQGKKLTGSGVTGTATFGYAVALSSDGTTAVVGGRQDDNNEGAVWVFTRKGELWSQQGTKLKGTGAINPAQQGESLAISADGNIIIVGGAADNNNKGAVWVFERSGSNWIQQATITPSDAAVGTVYFGNSVSLSAAGNTAVVGGFWNQSGKGAVWVFERNGNSWVQQGFAIIPAGINGAAKFGKSVSMNAAGNRFVAGAWDDNNGVGSAWVFEKQSNGIWQQQGNPLIAVDAVGQAKQGCSVAMSATGNTVVVGGYADNSNHGAAWVFEHINGNWIQQQKLVGRGSQPFSGLVFQGFAVSISADGNTIASGGYYDASAKGAVWVFHKSNGQWEPNQVKLQTADHIGSPYLGWSLQLSANGEALICGGIFDNGGRGAAWVFKVNPPIYPIQLNAKVNANNGVDINWQTSQELNCNFFNVWHATETQQWQKIGSVTAKNNVINDYHLQHFNPSSGINLYQIEKVFLNGNVVKSGIYRVDVIQQKIKDWQLYPNPSNGRNLLIELEKNPVEAIPVSIFSAEGKLVYTGMVTNKSFSLNKLSLMRGIYVIKLNGYSSKSLIVQ